MWDETRAGRTGHEAEDHLTEALDRSVRKLQHLNGRECRDTATRSLAWLDVDMLESAMTNGLLWEFAAIDGRDSDILSIRHRALAIIEPRRSLAIVHGDIHLRNILIRDEREPCFIDYAYSGPGHPCFDLVRLESAILFRCFRMTGDEAKIARLPLRVLEGRTSGKSLRSSRVSPVPWVTAWPSECAYVAAGPRWKSCGRTAAVRRTTLPSNSWSPARASACPSCRRASCGGLWLPSIRWSVLVGTARGSGRPTRAQPNRQRP